MDWEKIKHDREEYFIKLRIWLDEARLWYNLQLQVQSTANFPNAASGMPFPGPHDGSQATPYTAFPPNFGMGQQNQALPHMNNLNYNGVPLYQTYPCKLPSQTS